MIACIALVCDVALVHTLLQCSPLISFFSPCSTRPVALCGSRESHLQYTFMPNYSFMFYALLSTASFLWNVYRFIWWSPS